MDGALSRLQQLTRLAMECDTVDVLPPAVRGLGQLRLLYFIASGETPRQPLPAVGPWLQHLEGLAANADVLIPSSAVLAAAPQLKEVVLGMFPDPESPNFAACFANPTWRAFWDWAAAHPALSRLSFAVAAESPGPIWEPLFDAVVELVASAPQ